MSTSDGRPPRRRRIAGESKPGEQPPTTPAKKVVRRPVARPGAPASAPAEPAAAPEPEATAPAAPRVAPRVGRRPDKGTPEASAPERTTLEGTAPVAERETSEQARKDPVPARGEDTDDTVVAVGASGRRPDVPTLVLAVVALAAVAFGVVFGYRGVADWRATHGVEGAHAKAAEAAASAAETIFTYRYDQLEAYEKDANDVMTPSFAEDFRTISPALQDLAPQRKIQVEATTRDAAPENCGDDCRRGRAEVLVFVDQARLADGSSTPTVFGNRVQMTMVERDGRWLVDDIKAL